MNLYVDVERTRTVRINRGVAEQPCGVSTSAG
jgi:hypothetical protein